MESRGRMNDTTLTEPDNESKEKFAGNLKLTLQGWKVVVE